LLSALLRHRQFERLERFVSYYQDEFEADFRKEYWPQAALEAFGIPDPTFAPLLDAWAHRAPTSFAAFAARASYRDGLAWYYRGQDYAAETSEAQFQKLKELHHLALQDLKRALELRPKLVAAHTMKLSILNADGSADAKIEQVLKDGLKVCPQCFEIRARYLVSLTPRWGGSYAAMQRYTKGLAPLFAQNPKLKVLGGFADSDRCKVLRHEHKLSEAHVACDAALSFGDDPRSLTGKLRILKEQERYAEMLPYADRALRISPENHDPLRLRYNARLKIKDYLGAARDLALLRQLQPTESGHLKQIDWMVKRMRYDGDQLRKAGNGTQAALYYQLALQLAPEDADLKHRMAFADKGNLARLKSDLASNPDDFEAHLRVDNALAVQRRFGEVVDMWDEFIVKHPENAQAYYERGGAKYHLKQTDAALADLKQACGLHMQRACTDFERMRAKAAPQR
jgi:tetratricopeptide (TPR) repeat protein